MIDTAHAHDIRIVLDVVMNHPGYNSIYDMNEYGFGTLNGDAMDVYYNFSSINQTNYHGAIKYNENANNWAKWWGTNWIRAGLAGYQGGDGSDLRGEVTYLPDFKTESTSTVDLPEILKTKWTKEGTYSVKVSEINQTFSKYNLGNKTVTNYLVAWYAKWVEEYGIDGFRCDTAKHVDQSSWKKLSEACTKALQNWRNDNSSAVGADWDEEFWMTGENFGQGVSNNQYYQNGFDSMINFSFSGDSQGNNTNGMKKVGNLNSTYADYANQINNNANFNVLTYISSHDTGLCRDDLYYQGSALLLLPGGVQIYYGDETNRQYVDCTIHDHENRSFMNWSSISNASSNDAQILAHWQKVGTFRNNHVAVGAGAHTNLTASSGTAFARTYNKNGVTDKVACVVGASNNANITITLNNTFANGTVVRNAYDGTTATVANGKVTFNSGAHGTILVELAEGTPVTTAPTTVKPTTPDPTTVKPTTPDPTTTTAPVTPAVYVILGDSDLNEIVNIKDATLIQKVVAELETIDGNAKIAADADESSVVNIKDATAIQKFAAELDAGCRVGEKIKVSGSDAPTPTQPVTTVPGDDPVETTVTDAPDDNTIDLTQIEGQIIILANNTYATPYQHCWTDGGDAYNTWPGEALQQIGGYYVAIIPDAANMIIFNDNNGNQTADLSIPGEFAIYDMSTGSWAGFLSDFVDVTKFPADGLNIPTPGPTPTNPVDPDPSGNYIYFRDAAGWGTAYCHYWSDNSGSVWPGDQMESLGNNLYRFALPNDSTGAMYQKVVFNNGNNGAQTVDLIVELGRAYNNQTNQWEDVN
ncbi:MAG: starch-binding protein [Ruminococcus sp.]|nr:starch-binding protein [Ruminococcus sp.]